ncbi:hypothetical protein D3C86_2027900 [compost metagenome]
MTITIGTTGISPSDFTIDKPSTADATDIGGVMIPSANKVVAPRIVGITSHFPCFRTKA